MIIGSDIGIFGENSVKRMVNNTTTGWSISLFKIY